MNLAEQYARQWAWRPWPAILDALPSLAGCNVLDLGCAVGDQAAALAARGAHVIGIDSNEELLQAARSRGLANVEFRRADLRTLADAGLPAEGAAADGLWSSFAAAYFTDLSAPLSAWARHLRPGGWIVLTEIDNMFGHEPVGARTRELLESYARDALHAGRYDFHMGRKLAGFLRQAGFTVHEERTLEDRELAFRGPVSPEVIDAWRARLDLMKLLHAHCGAEYPQIRDDFLRCLSLPDHRTTASVRCCLARR